MGLSQANVASLNQRKARVDQLYNDLVVEVDRFAKAASTGAISDERDVVDGAYICKLMSEKFDDLRKECNKALEAASRWACEQHTMKELAGIMPDGVIRAQLCSASTKVKMVPVLPKKGTQEYYDMCIDLGVTDWAFQHELFHAHWPGVVEKCNALLAAGMPLPKGIDKSLVKTSKGLDFDVKKSMDLSFKKAKD